MRARGSPQGKAWLSRHEPMALETGHGNRKCRHHGQIQQQPRGLPWALLSEQPTITSNLQQSHLKVTLHPLQPPTITHHHTSHIITHHRTPSRVICIASTGATSDHPCFTLPAVVVINSLEVTPHFFLFFVASLETRGVRPAMISNSVIVWLFGLCFFVCCCVRVFVTLSGETQVCCSYFAFEISPPPFYDQRIHFIDR